MKSEPFYVTAPWDASLELYPNNKRSNYTFQLQQPIRLNGSFEVALVELQYIYDIENVIFDEKQPQILITVRKDILTEYVDFSPKNYDFSYLDQHHRRYFNLITETIDYLSQVADILYKAYSEVYKISYLKEKLFKNFKIFSDLLNKGKSKLLKGGPNWLLHIQLMSLKKVIYKYFGSLRILDELVGLKNSDAIFSKIQNGYMTWTYKVIQVFSTDHDQSKEFNYSSLYPSIFLSLSEDEIKNNLILHGKNIKKVKNLKNNLGTPKREKRGLGLVAIATKGVSSAKGVASAVVGAKEGIEAGVNIFKLVKNFINSESDSDMIAKLPIESYTKYKGDYDHRMCTISVFLKKGFYKNPIDLINHINSQLKSECSITNLDRVIKFGYDNQENKIFIKSNGHFHVTKLSDQFEKITGLSTSNIVFNESFKLNTAIKEINFHKAYENLFVYSSIADYSFIGDTLKQVLRIVSTHESSDNYTVHEFNNPHYVNVSQTEISTIEVKLLNYNNNEFLFKTGNIICKFHFRPKPLYL